MTIEELIASSDDFVRVQDVAKILKCDPQSIRREARRNESRLGFKTVVVGSRVLIPRVALLKYLELL